MFSVQTTNVYVLSNRQILLIRRSPEDESKALWWESPSGHVDVLCQAIDSHKVRREALRELFEETGINTSTSSLRHLPSLSTSRHMSYALHLKKRRPNITLSEEHCSYLWLTIGDPPPKNTRYEVRRFLRDILSV